MKHFVLIVLLILGSSISFGAQSPEFVRTKNWKIEQLRKNNVVLTTTAVFYNPNKAKAKLRSTDLDVWIAKTKVGKVQQAKRKVRIPRKNSFEIPLVIDVKPETNAWGYIMGMLSAISLQDTTVTLKGTIKIRVMGIAVRLKVDETEDVNIKHLL